MLEMLPPVTRPKMFDVASPESFEKIRDVVVRDVEVPEAMEQISTTSWPRPACDVVLRLSAWKSDRWTDLRIQTSACDRRSRLHQVGLTSE
jgi:hypothetical protein